MWCAAKAPTDRAPKIGNLSPLRMCYTDDNFRKRRVWPLPQSIYSAFPVDKVSQVIENRCFEDGVHGYARVNAISRH